MFDKSAHSFLIKKRYIFLNHCGVSPLYRGALEAEKRFLEAQAATGNLLFREYGDFLGRLHEAAAALLQVSPDDISFTKSTAESLNLIANGYPFAAGDEIISYAHEYPSNHYPWVLQQRRGAVLKLLRDSDPLGGLKAGRPRGWSLEDLEALITDRTRLIALSHVQFTSGYAANLEQVGALCRRRGIDLVIDASQSLGALPVYPRQWGIGAVAACGCKWLLGPAGAVIMYTSPELRSKIELTHGGPYMMRQETDYLNYTWDPYSSGRRFEYSSVNYSAACGLEASLRDLFLGCAPESIREEIFRLQDLFLRSLDQSRVRALLFPAAHRSGILSLIVPGDSEALVRALEKTGVVCTARGGYLRIAPHFCSTDSEVLRAAEALNECARAVTLKGRFFEW